jgi:glyoxylase-like metal-dependent hydrolase (beta-lactamase superfamily II)
VITAPPILHLLRVLAEDGPEAGLARMRNPVEANLGPHRRIEFQPGVVLFPLPTPTLPPAAHTNCYLLGFGEAVLVDPGSPYEQEIAGLLEAVAAAAEQGRRVGAIWLTHHHPDHVGGVERVRAALGVPVLAHPATAERLAPLGIGVDGALEDGQRIVLAGDPELRVRVLHTPGHARGHLCFLEERTGAVIAGDLIAGFGTIVIDPPEGDMDDYLASLVRVAELEPRTLFPAHGPTVRAAVAKLHEYVEHRLWREDRILEAWRSGLREPMELVRRVYDDVPEIAHPLAARQLQAHLDRLERRGKLR